ncbi:BspA family leucine-rich repeat surface protein, partial [Limosilactobacillus fermentum]
VQSSQPAQSAADAAVATADSAQSAADAAIASAQVTSDAVSAISSATAEAKAGANDATIRAKSAWDVAVQSSQPAQNNQSVQGNQTNQTVPSSAPAQSNQTAENNQSVQESRINQGGNQSTSTTPTTETAFAATNSSDGLDPSIYGTVNVRDWDYQKDNNLINLTGYHGTNLQHIIIPNLNDFNNSSIDISGTEDVGITSTVLKKILGQLNGPDYTVAISKTNGPLNSKVTAENGDWQNVFLKDWKDKRDLVYADLTNLDTSKITNMTAMFACQEKLKVLKGLDSWNTSKVTNMSNMFQYDSDLATLNLSKWDTSKVTDMHGMFCNTTSLQTVGSLDNWNTSNVTEMQGVFFGTDNLQTVGNLSNWNTSKVTDMSDMFYHAKALQSVGDIGNWDTSNVTDMSGMFWDTTSLQTVGNLSNWDTSKVTNMSDMFYHAKALQSIGDLSNWNTSKVTSMSYMFCGTNLKNIGNIGNWDTSNVTDMSGMFYLDYSLQSINDLSQWDTSKVTNMSSMFSFDSALQSIGDLSNWNTSNVTDMSEMFCNTTSLQTVGNLSNWDTSKVTNMLDTLGNTKIDYFVVSRSDNSFINTLHLIDSNGLMGQPGETIATIKAPTFYKLEPDGNKNASVYDTVFPLVQKKANEEYEKFLNGLTEGMRNIYPTKVSLKWVLNRGQVPTPTDNANATFTYNMKIGTLKYFVINYVDKTGNVVGNIVGSEILPGAIGSTVPLPKKLSLPSGYQLVSGQVIPTSVTFEKGKLQAVDIYVEKESKTPVVQKGSINYVDQDGKVIKTDTISGKVGDQINVKLSLPDGYELANKDEQIPSSITVGEDGINTITIQVKKLPVVQTGSINYVDQDGKVIKTDTISGKVGDQINVKLSLPDGYELANKDEQIPSTVTVTEDGISPISVNIKKINTTPTTPVNPTEPNNQTSTSNNEAASIPEKSTPNTFKNINGSTYYYDENGNLYRNQFYSNWGHTYYFGPDGARYTDQFLGKDGKVYYFDNQGIMYQDQYYKNWGHTYYFGADGARYTDQFLGKDGKVYYFDNQGIMYQDQYYKNWG